MRRENHWLDTSYLFEEDTKGRKKKKGNPPLEKDEEEDFVLFEEEDLEENRQSSERSAAEEEKYEKEFIDFFMEEAGIEEEEERYLSPMQRASIERSNNIYERYKAGEEWLMSEGGDDLAKGFVNRLRSTPGEAIEDLAYFLHDFIPEDTDGKLMRWLRNNAKKVVDNNMAGQIGNKATEQFDWAKERTGYLGDRLIDAADSTASMLSYGTFFGPSHLALSQSIGEGLDEYRYHRESGVDKSEALTRGGLAGLTSYFIEKSGGIGTNDIYIPKINTSKVKNVLDAVIKNAVQEGGEAFAEYTVNSFADAMADAIFKGEVSFDFDLIEAFNEALTGSIVGGGFGGVKSVSGRNLTTNNLIKSDISEKDRYKILKNSYINIAEAKNTLKYNKEISEIEMFPPKAKSSVEKNIKKIAEEAGIINNEFNVDGISFGFEMGKNRGLSKSLHNQTLYDGSYSELTKTLINMEEVISNAIIVESHTADKYKGTLRENKNFEEGCTLLGAFQDGKNIIPVKMTIKKDNGRKGNLYVVVAMAGIERTSVMGRGATIKTSPALPVTGSIYSLPQIVSKINASNGEFLKHIPDHLLSFEQRVAKHKALVNENNKLEKMKRERKEKEMHMCF